MGLRACVCDLADLNEGCRPPTMAVGSVHFSHCCLPVPRRMGDGGGKGHFQNSLKLRIITTSLCPFLRGLSPGTTPFLAPNVPRTIIAPVVVKPLGVEMDDVSTDVIQEALVMGDDEQCLPPALEVAGF